MPTKNKPSASNEDILFLLEKLYDNFESFKKENARDHAQFHNKLTHFQKKLDQFETQQVNLIGTVAKIEENLTVGGYHNQQHFDKNEHQDKRLDRIEHHLALPALAT